MFTNNNPNITKIFMSATPNSDPAILSTRSLIINAKTKQITPKIRLWGLTTRDTKIPAVNNTDGMALYFRSNKLDIINRPKIIKDNDVII